MMRIKKLKKSFQHALRGFWYALQTEQNFRILFAFGVVIVVLGIFLRVNAVHFALLILVVSAMWTIELLNTVMEKFVDMVRPRIHHYAAHIKDITAAAVLLMSIAALVVVILIFSIYLP